MFISGMGQNEMDYGYEDDYGMTGGQLPAPSQSWPTGSTDWAGLIGTALKTWGTVETVQAQTEAQKAMAARGVMPAQYYSPYNMSPLPRAYGTPGYLPYPGAGGGGTLFGFSPVTVGIGLLLIGGIAYALSNR